MGRAMEYGRLQPLCEGEGRAITVRDNAHRRAMHLANIEFLNRLRAEHERAGRGTRFS